MAKSKGTAFPSWSIPPVRFRVTAAQRTELDTEGERKGISGNAVAKLRAFPVRKRR